MATSLLSLHFFSFCYYYEQGNDNKLVAITHFIFTLLEAKMGDDNKFVVIIFILFSISVVAKKATIVIIALFKCSAAKNAMVC
jgi:hypothetical protein